jgi:formyltetrahydrofolate deformylase
MVSKFDHTMLHLLYQIRVGWLDAEVAAIISNHEDSRATADYEEVPYHYFPLPRGGDKAAQEEQILGVVKETGADLVVLARYMQILSDASRRGSTGRSSTSTTRSCPASRAPSPITRRMSAA